MTATEWERYFRSHGPLTREIVTTLSRANAPVAFKTMAATSSVTNTALRQALGRLERAGILRKLARGLFELREPYPDLQGDVFL